MDKVENLFDEFSAVSKEEWKAKVERDLKGRPYDDLKWHLDQDIVLEPFYTADEIDEEYQVLTPGRHDNNWKVGEYVDIYDIGEANAQLLEGLEGGVEAPLIRLVRQHTDEELARLLDGVDTGGISLHFGQYFAGKDPRRFFDQLVSLWQKKNLELSQIQGTLDYDPLLDWSIPPLDEIADLVNYCSEQMPHFGVVQVNARRFHSGSEDTVRELAYTIAKGSEYLAQLDKRKVSPSVTNRHMQFTIAVSTSYFVEIAKLRALRLLWANVLEAYGIENESFPQIEGHFARDSQVVDVNTNMIRAATQAMSAVIGGVDRLYVLPSNAYTEEKSTPFNRRIGRNLQHILKMESHLHRVADPAAGSYYIEKLTGLLAQKAWKEFRDIEAKGGFMNLT